MKSKNISKQPYLRHVFGPSMMLALKDPYTQYHEEAFEKYKTEKKFQEALDDMMENPTTWGVVIGSYGYDAYLRAQELFAFGVVPDGMHLVCLGHESYDEEIAEALREFGITVIYDAYGITPYKTLADGLVRAEDSRSLVYTGRVPDDIKSHLDREEAARYEKQLLMGIMKNSWDWKWEVRDADPPLDIDLALLVEKLSFGRKSYGKDVDQIHLSIAGWRRHWISPEVFDSYDFENDGSLPPVEDMMSILEIWKGRLDQIGLELHAKGLAAPSLPQLEEIGYALGIDRDVDAYCEGVPVEDILA